MPVRLGAGCVAAALWLLAAPAIAQEPSWWTARKKACGISSGTAYNDWVDRGSPCNSGGSGGSGSSSGRSGSVRSVAPSPSEIATAINNRGLEAHKRGDLEAALALFEEAARTWSGNAVINDNLAKTRTAVDALHERQRQEAALRDAIRDLAAAPGAPSSAPPSSGLQFQTGKPQASKSQGTGAPLAFMPEASGSARIGSGGSGTPAAAPPLAFMPTDGDARRQLGSASVSGDRAAAGQGLKDHEGESRGGTGRPVLQATGAGEGASAEARSTFDTPGVSQTPRPVVVAAPGTSSDPVVPATLQKNPRVMEMERRRAEARVRIAVLQDERDHLKPQDRTDQVRMSEIDNAISNQRNEINYTNVEIRTVVMGAPVILDDEPATDAPALSANPAAGTGSGP